MSFLLGLCIVLFIIVCVFLMLLILIQKGRGGGLASAFGGMGGNTAFGSKTGDVLTWATSIVFGIFIVLAVALNLLSNYRPGATAANVPPAAPAPVQPPGGPAPVVPAEPAPTGLPGGPAAPTLPER